jgi:hypothetical protein
MTVTKPARRENPMSWRTGTGVAGRPWKGAVREYDLFKELTIGLIAVILLVLAASAIFGSPDDKAVSLKSWAIAQPSDFIATATAELGGTSDTAGYGPPYNSTPGATQTLGPIDLQTLAGVKLPIDTAQAFVLGPLSSLPTPPSGVATWKAASADQRTAWTDAYAKALDKAKNNDPANVAAGDYGPVPAMMRTLLTMATQGSLDSVISAQGKFYNLDYTPAILFMGDGAYLNGLAAGLHLSGDQWGMMNETGNYPGQAWLWLYTAWYQVPPMKTSSNADLEVWAIMMALTVVLIFLPFIPVLRSIPRWSRVYRLIWRQHYRSLA